MRNDEKGLWKETRKGKKKWRALKGNPPAALTYILNSAHFVQFPNLGSSSPAILPSAAFPAAQYSFSPTAPPIMLTPATHSATSGNALNMTATFVSPPVATLHAFPFS